MNRGNQAAEANRTPWGQSEQHRRTNRAATANERHGMMRSKQIVIPPAAANRPPAYSSLARGRGNNLSKQIDESGREGAGREGKESNLISSHRIVS